MNIRTALQALDAAIPKTRGLIYTDVPARVVSKTIDLDADLYCGWRDEPDDGPLLEEVWLRGVNVTGVFRFTQLDDIADALIATLRQQAEDDHLSDRVAALEQA